jgi:hypothetical protein
VPTIAGNGMQVTSNLKHIFRCEHQKYHAIQAMYPQSFWKPATRIVEFFFFNFQIEPNNYKSFESLGCLFFFLNLPWIPGSGSGLVMKSAPRCRRWKRHRWGPKILVRWKLGYRVPPLRKAPVEQLHFVGIFSYFEKAPEVFDTTMFQGFEHCSVEDLADCCN